VYLYTGEGEGKTTNAFGLALRAVGHGHRAIIVQFMKGRREGIGEYRVQERLKPLYEVHQFGREEFIDFKHPMEEDYRLARKALEFARQALKEKPRILVLDEVNLAVHFGILPLKDVLELIEKVPPETTLVLTGRRAPKELIEKADLATEMKMIKHPYEKGIEAREGVEY